jgi:hypothetical protein
LSCLCNAACGAPRKGTPSPCGARGNVPLAASLASFLAGVLSKSLFSLQAVFPFWKNGGGFLAQEFVGAQKNAAAFPAKGKRLCAGRRPAIPALGAGYFLFEGVNHGY